MLPLRRTTIATRAADAEARAQKSKAQIAAELRTLRGSLSEVLYGSAYEAEVALRSVATLTGPGSSIAREACDTILQLDGVVPLLRVLRDDESEPAMLADCLSILRDVATHAEDGPQVLAAKEVIPALMAALASPSDAVLRAAALCATALCSTFHTATLLLDAGLVAAAKRLARGHPAVRKGAAEIFSALTEAPAHRASIVHESVLDALLDIVYPRRLPNGGEPEEEEEEVSPHHSPNPQMRRRRSSLLPPPPPKPPVDDGRLQGLESVSRLCSQGDFCDALYATPNLFELLFELCDTRDLRMEVRSLSQHARAAGPPPPPWTPSPSPPPSTPPSTPAWTAAERPAWTAASRGVWTAAERAA